MTHDDKVSISPCFSLLSTLIDSVLSLICRLDTDNCTMTVKNTSPMPFVFVLYLTVVRRSWRFGWSLLLFRQHFLNVKLKEQFKRNVSTYILKWMGIKVGIRFWGKMWVGGWGGVGGQSIPSHHQYRGVGGG